MADLSEVKDLIEAQAKARKAEIEALESKMLTKAEKDEILAKINADFTSLRKEAEDREKEHAKQLLEIEKKAGRPQAGSGDLTPEQAEYRKAFGAWLRKGEGDGAQLRELGRKAMNSQTDSAGGYLVLPEMDMTIDRIAPTISAMFRIANVVPIGTAKYTKMVKTAGMSMRRIGDGSAGGETTEPTFARIEIEAHTAEVEPWVNQETLDDAEINLEADLANEAAIAFAEGAGSEFITGNGVGTARGITSYTNIADASYSWGSVGYIATGKSAAFASVAPADKVVALQHALKAQYRPGAVFLTNDSTLSTMRQFKDASGSYYLWNPDPAAGFGGRFLGSPVEIDDNIAAIGAGSYSLAYGNFKRGYTIVQRQGTTLLRDPYTGKGVVKFNFRRRFGGGITHYEAIKLLRFATS